MRGSYRTQDGQAQIDWTLNDGEFSAIGEYKGSSGQCLEAIASAYPDDPMVKRMVAVWREFHLNDMKPGLPVQEAAVKKWLADGHEYNYDEVCNMLKERGLYEVEVPEGVEATGGFAPGPYQYGTRWVHQPLPAEIVTEIESWPCELTPLSDSKAEQFLADRGLTLTAKPSSKPCPWGGSQDHYRITLTGAGRRLKFDFWSSSEPTAYDVLETIGADVACPDTFEEYCAEFGETDKATYKKIKAHATKLKRFFTAVELEELTNERF